jgi:phosphoglycerate dehydrogenase-like enzyme
MRVVATRDRAEIEALLGEIEIAAGWFPTDLVARAPRLRWFQQWGAGADWLLRYPQASEQNFILTSASGVHAIPISEQIIGTMLMFARGMHQAVRAQTAHTWSQPPEGSLFELEGKTLLLIGVGAIGARTALLARALGMQVVGLRQHPERPVDGVDTMEGLDRLHQRLAQADVVALTIPLTAATRGLIGRAELQRMKPTAYLINIGRGGTVDEPALVEALTERWIAGAGLDVFAEEPLPASSPLWALEQVIITAHYAGATPEYDARAMAIFLDNLRRYSTGAPLHNVVDKQQGY